jgi:3D (Asp-Asp-Asp) domain-containing protein
MLFTFYCCCTLCTPGHNLTASGVKPTPGITCALNHVPFGTIIPTPLGPRIVQDRMHKRYSTNHCDIFVTSHSEAVRLGVMKTP